MLRPQLIVLQPTAYCNINCAYCYLGNRDDRRLMSAAVVDAIAIKLLARLPRDHAPTIVWHAGEPTAAPLRWYEAAQARLAAAAPAATQFAMQSNGIAIDERWIAWFRRSRTAVNLSIDGPQRFHDARRRTRSDGPTWMLAMRGLKRLQDAGLSPGVITVLHPEGLSRADEYYAFYRDHGITEVSFSIDEIEGANRRSSFRGDDKELVTRFLLDLLERAFDDQMPLCIREVERIAHVLAGKQTVANELVEPWASIVVAVDGKVSTFSPEIMEVTAPQYGDFVVGNILNGDIDDFARGPDFIHLCGDVSAGIEACRSTCRYFGVCGGGSPVNKYCEQGTLAATETQFCRLTTQTAADALLSFIERHRRRTDELQADDAERARSAIARAFSGEVDTGSPSENATKQQLLEHDPIQSERIVL